MIALRTQRRNRQKMFYSLPGQLVKRYKRDDEGNIEYLYIDGEQVPVEVGEPYLSYGEPVGFKGAVYSQLENAIVRAYGSDNSNNFATLVLAKKAKDENGNLLDFTNGTLIWLKNEIKYKDSGEIDESSANYKIAGILDEELNENSYYLQKLDGEEKNNEN